MDAMQGRFWDWKLLLSRLDRPVSGWMNATCQSGDVILDGGIEIGHSAIRVLKGLSFVYRRPMFAVSVGVIFQSS